MKYLTSENLPTIECCNIEYTWLEREEECLLCGEAFDWEDAETHWDRDALDQWEAENGVMEGEEEDDGSWNGPHHGTMMKFRQPSDDDDDKGWSEASLFRDHNFKLFNEAYKGKGGHTYADPRDDRPKVDIFLDRDIPNEVL